MAGFLDPLFIDPTQDDGGYLARLLGISPTAATETPTLNGGLPLSGLLGNSPMANAVRGGLMGLDAGGAPGFWNELGRGLAASTAYADRRRRQLVRDRLLQRQVDQEGQASAAGVHGTSPGTLATPKRYEKGDVVIDAYGRRWRYRGFGDPTDQASWEACE